MGNFVSSASAHVADDGETAARPLKRHRTEIDAAVTEPPSKKRSATSILSSSRCLGLEFPNGNVRYVHRSTLVNAGGYFKAYFGDNGIPAVPDRTDEHGRNIYFIARSGELFDNHILPFIIGKIPGEVPPFSERPALWRLLREEAKFYGLDDLYEKLRVTHSCPYIIGDDRGVLYWLGTDKGMEEYNNPHEIGAVAVHVGKLGDVTADERTEISESHNVKLDSRALLPKSRQALVQYRPRIVGYDEVADEFYIDVLDKCHSLGCNMSLSKIPTIVDLRTVSLRLMAYSLRADHHSMTDWNLEASQDGENWTVLHEARNDRHLAAVSDDLYTQWGKDLEVCSTIEEKVQVTQELAEGERRHTWEIATPSDVFFRYFRIIGSGTDYERAEDSSECLHCVGLELYGSIHEE